MAVYDLTLVAADDAGKSGSTRVRVVVTDVNDEDPVFQQPQYTAFIDENSLEGTLVLPFLNGFSVRIQAMDNDQPDTPNSLVRYSLDGINAPKFTIDPVSGIVRVARGTATLL